MSEEPLFEPSYEEHKRAQIRRMARESTPEERLKWLEEAHKFVHSLGIDYLAQKRKRQGKSEDDW